MRIRLLSASPRQARCFGPFSPFAHTLPKTRTNARNTRFAAERGATGYQPTFACNFHPGMLLFPNSCLWSPLQVRGLLGKSVRSALRGLSAHQQPRVDPSAVHWGVPTAQGAPSRKSIMRTTAAISSLCLSSTLGGDAFVLPHQPTRALSSGLHHHPSRAPSAAATPGATAPPRLLLARPTIQLSGENGSVNGVNNPAAGVRRVRRRPAAGGLSMTSSFDPAAGDSSPRAATPTGPGAGVIDLQFESLKAGGFKVFLLFFLLGVRVTYVYVREVRSATTAAEIMCRVGSFL